MKADGRIESIPFEALVLRDQVRKSFRGIDELARSIEQLGLLTALTVRLEDGAYVIQAGERRYRAITRLRNESAANRERFARLNCVVFEQVKDDQLVLAQLAENTARAELRPWEIGAALVSLTRAGFTQGQVGARIGKSQQWCSDHIRWHENIHPDVLKTLSNMLPEAVPRRLLDRLAKLTTVDMRGTKRPNVEAQRQVLAQLSREGPGLKGLSLRKMIHRMAQLRADWLPNAERDVRESVERVLAYLEHGEHAAFFGLQDQPTRRESAHARI